MSNIRLAGGVAIVLGLLLTTTPAARTPLLELDSCHDDLDHLRRMASDASDAAEHAKSAFDDLDDCKSNPELYDLSHDRCRNRQDDYESALSDFNSTMEDIDSNLRSVQTSCEYNFTINRLSAAEAAQRHAEAAQRRLDASKRRLCVSLKGLGSLGASPAQLLQMCKATGGDEQICKECIGLK